MSDQSKYSEAKALLSDARDIYKHDNDSCTDGVSYCLSNLACIYGQLGKNEVALSLINEAISIRERMDYHQIDLAYTSLLRDKAILDADTGNADSAIPSIEKCEAIIRGIVGELHPEYIQCRMAHGHILEGQGEFKRAKEVYHDAEQIALHLLGEHHPLYAKIQVSIAHCPNDNKTTLPKNAIQRLERVIELQTQMGNISLVITAKNNLAYEYLTNQDFESAARLYQEVMKARVDGLGFYHNDVAVAVGNLGLCYWNLGYIALADGCISNAIRIYLKIGTPQTKDTFNCLRTSSRFFESQNDFLTAKIVRRIIAEKFAELRDLEQEN